MTRESIDILIDFIDVSIHMILFQRGLYPPELFSKRRARHPQLNEYISDILTALHGDLCQNKVNKIYIVITNGHSVLEKFTFHVSRSGSTSVMNMGQVEEQLRAFCRSICVSDTYLRPNPDNATFAIYAELIGKDPTPISYSQGSPWIPCELGDLAIETADVVPLTRLLLGDFSVQLIVEESVSSKLNHSHSQRTHTMPDSLSTPS